VPQDASEAPLNRRDRRRLEIYERIVEAGEALFEEQRSHNECAVKRFLLDARSGAYPLKTNDYQVLRGEQKLTALEQFAHLKKYMSESGAVSNIDSAMSLGHCLAKRYQTLAPTLEGRVCKYLLALPG